jgi:hypothetical protein
MITVQKTHKKYFKQFQSLTMITYLELGITDGITVRLVSVYIWRHVDYYLYLYVLQSSSAQRLFDHPLHIKKWFMRFCN